MFKSYINPTENKEAKKKLPKLMVEGLLLGGSGLGVLALIFEIAADAFSVAAYQTLLAIHGAEGHHEIAIHRLYCPLSPVAIGDCTCLQSRCIPTAECWGQRATRRSHWATQGCAGYPGSAQASSFSMPS